MDSDVWERARRFVEEGERQQAEKEAILAQYERVNIHGKVLVDGTTCFWKCSETSKRSTIMWKSIRASSAV